MATMTVSGDQPIWKPGKSAIWCERWVDPNDSGPTAVLLRHPTAPFPTSPAFVVDRIDDETIDSKIRQLAFDYLSLASKLPEIDPPLDLPEGWLEQLNPAHGLADPTLRWLPSGWPPKGSIEEAQSADPLVSFRVVRHSTGDIADQTIILLASEWCKAESGDAYLGSEFGIRVVAHARRRSDGRYEVRITGMSASLPFARYREHGVSTKRWASQRAFDLVRESKPAVTAEMAKMLGLQEGSVRIRGLRLAEIDGVIEATQVERRCTGKAQTSGGRTDAMHYSFVFVGTPDKAGALVSKVELVADATPPVPGHARMFPRDPASHGAARHVRRRRRTRSEEELDKCRVEAEITAGQHDPLQYPRGSGSDMKVVVCRPFVLEDRKPGINPGDTKKVDLPGTGPAIRSNDFSAVMAYWNFVQFFQRLEAYGIQAGHYFRIAKLPLQVFYRSGIRPGPGKDGQAVNARVLVEGWPVDFEGPTKPGERPGLEVHLALANLSHRARKPWNGKKRSPAEPLGIAADARWIWHEIGHVLLMASVGEPQFRFCHSPGDALAAIVADPRSQLTKDANWRGATFPWVFIPRRHDRCVSHGWSWGGSLHHAMSQVPKTQAPRRKGYWTEQILSSSLFRLYRCIGGDTTQVGSPDQPDVDLRESASHYSTYLIMRAVQILGDTGVVPAHEPDQFVSALIDADIGTEKWDVIFPPAGAALPQGETRFEFHRVGGCVHKVIRWAFEAQGLYTPPGKITNAPGTPPPVDVYIEDRRPTSDEACGVQYGPGSYAPVSLDWDPRQRRLDEPPAWQAKADAIEVIGGGVYVTVKNRGNQPAVDVSVRVWWYEWPDNGAPPPKWKESGWNECGQPPTGQVQTVNPGTPARFGPFSGLPSGNRTLVFAQATCGDDFANTDTATQLACSREPTPLVDLVAGDNNLGLIVAWL